MDAQKAADTDKIASKFLGKNVKESLNYNPELLVAVPRCENRRQYKIDENNLPFEGFDVWHAYEFSCLTENGMPVTRLLKLKYNSTSPFIVESKSLKLYLNSFNMTKYGKNTTDCLEICKKIIKQLRLLHILFQIMQKKSKFFKNLLILCNFLTKMN